MSAMRAIHSGLFTYGTGASCNHFFSVPIIEVFNEDIIENVTMVRTTFAVIKHLLLVFCSLMATIVCHKL